ncbi:IclR family transcriptional regulator [Ammoniphilus resinae]|uniref:DNA-binding IclR family transcriptional regulator n=1 Tax=Ammoniphilus resinae TaxID=861532 RepID=A0ABS4GUZ8_9BACL|nr:IclR family transcriptional regulator [Ammoniphilus resinae]MBP1934082.1 DNA-binding IclR family transcriptional regulator [Ammoniphilus resinae]
MRLIQAVDRALKILDLFDEHEMELKITEISERLDLHKSTVHSILKTLQYHGYIGQNTENGKYKLGMKLLERGNFVIQGLDIRKIAKRNLHDLSMRTGQTTHLVVLDGKHGVYIDKVEGPLAVVLYSRIGRRVSIHCSAVGKVLVGNQRQEKIEEILADYQYERRAKNTITDRESYLKELELVRQRGYSIDNEENEEGVRSVAVPIRDHSGQVIAAISLSSLLSSIDDETFTGFIKMVQETGQAISEQMGYGLG